MSGGHFNMDDWGVFFHSISGASIIGTLVGWFPPIAAFVAFLWYSVQLYESATVQTWLTTRRLRKIARYRKLLATLEAADKKATARKKLKDETDGLE